MNARQRVVREIYRRRRGEFFDNLHKDGLTLSVIGDLEGLTRERVRMVIYSGLNSSKKHAQWSTTIDHFKRNSPRQYKETM